MQHFNCCVIMSEISNTLFKKRLSLFLIGNMWTEILFLFLSVSSKAVYIVTLKKKFIFSLFYNLPINIGLQICSLLVGILYYTTVL